MKLIDIKNNLDELKNNSLISDYELLISDRHDEDVDVWVDVKIKPITPANNITVKFDVKKI